MWLLLQRSRFFDMQIVFSVNKFKGYEMTKFSFNIVAILIVGVLSFFVNASSSGVCYAEEIKDTWGREFFFTFPPNFHNNPTQYEDSIFIFVSAEEEASFELTYKGRYFVDNQERYQEFVVTGTIQPNETYVVDIPFRTLAPGEFTPSFNDLFFELEGYKMQGIGQEPSPRRQNGAIAQQVFRLTSDVEVSVYALDQSRTTSDAMVVLPTDILDTEYAVLSYNSDGRNFSDNTPSQFAVVATEDNTIVDFTLSMEAQDEPTTEFEVELQRGEAYLVQCSRQSINSSPDVSGSFVTSDKPIAVFAGHQRAVLPLEQSGASRDMLLEQVPPISTLGLYYFVAPFPLPSGVFSSSGDIYRVLATRNNTDLIIDRTDTITLQKGEIYEAALIQAHELVSSKPVLVATYKKTSRLDNVGQEFGDPFMMFIPPVEQFMRRYLVTNAITFEENAGNWQEVYQEQYVLLTIPTESIQQTRVDNNTVNASDFRPIGTSGYSFGVVNVVGGVHDVVSDTVFGINVFGYGGANSYGYVGGMQFREIYGPSLVLDSAAECFSITGEVVDTLALDIDTPVQWVEFPEEFLDNVTVQLDDVSEPSDSVKFVASLIDEYRDGSVRVISANVFEHRLETDFVVPGFDVHVDASLVGKEVVEIDDPLWYGQDSVYQFVLTNNSVGAHTIDRLYLRQNSQGLELMTSGIPLPIVLEPGESVTIPVLFNGTVEGSIVDTLCVQSSCIERPVVAFNYQVRRDVDPPTSDVQFDSCVSEILVLLDDSGINQHGIQDYSIVSTLNCDVEVDDTFLPDQLRLTLTKIDSLQAVGYEIIVVDSSGNQTIISDTLSTIGFRLVGTEPYKFVVNTYSGNLVCGSVIVYNDTEAATEVTRASMLEFVEFSYPLSQLPLYVPPMDSAVFEVCFRSEQIGVFTDFLSLGAGCLNSTIELVGIVDPIIGEGRSRCEVVLSGQQVSTDALVLDPPFPNPASSEITSTLHVPNEATLSFRIATMAGEVVDAGTLGTMTRGTYSVTLPMQNLSDGVYVLVITNGTDIVQRKISIIR